MKYLIIGSISFLIASCGGPAFVDTSNLPDTYQCTYMKEVCKEAREFEGKYAQLTPEEKKEFKTFLQTYQSQCNNALEACKKSSPSK